MLSTALRTVRARWVSFVGSFVALALGVGLIAAMGLGLAATLDAPQRGPERFARAPVVVKGNDTLRVPTPNGDRTGRLAHPAPVSPELARRLAALGPTTEDRSFPVRADGGPQRLVGHPWSVAAFAPYTLDAGRAPQADGEVVTTGWARPGDRLTTDRGPATVVGTVRPPAATGSRTPSSGPTRPPPGCRPPSTSSSSPPTPPPYGPRSVRTPRYGS